MDCNVFKNTFVVMKETKQLKVRYRAGLMHKGELNGKPYAEYEYEYFKSSTNHVKRFNNAICLLMGITGCEHHLIDYLSENMTESGYVHNNEVTRQAFITFYSKWKKSNNKSYSDHAVKKAFQNLADDGFLVSITRGVYLVNPDLYFSAGDDARIKSIKYMMEFKAGVETKINVEVKK